MPQLFGDMVHIYISVQTREQGRGLSLTWVRRRHCRRNQLSKLDTQERELIIAKLETNNGLEIGW